MTKQALFTSDYLQPEHEIIIKFKSDDLEWIDPLEEVWIEEGKLFVSNPYNTYDYKLSDIVDFNIRVYSSENIWDY